ncbi:MAG: amidase, partial [Gammaproteobacteria bacterium]|nr:amidase [Gammaproteobacteria bacterium]
RSPSNSSSGSGSSVAANLVTCAIAEETGSSIRGPARANNAVGIAPTQELISRDGMIQLGINTRVGPICRTVEDAAKVLTAYAGYDPKDELTVYSIGRKPWQPYESFASPGRLEGLRIGVVRELFNTSELSAASMDTVQLTNAAIADLKALGAEIIDPGDGGALLTTCVREYAPRLGNTLFTAMYPELFPVVDGKPVGDHIHTLMGMVQNPSTVPDDFSFNSLPRGAAEGESRFEMNRYLAERGDAEIKTNTDLVNKANWLDDPNYPDFKGRRIEQDKERVLDMSRRMLDRFMVQTTILQCMQSMNLTAMVYPTANLPPEKLGSPSLPTNRGRASSSSLGRQGFPAISVPAGFTNEMYDRVVDASLPAQSDGSPGTRLVGPIPAKLPVGIDFVGRPFDEPTLIRIAAAYEATTHHRQPPPAFAPLAGEP